MVVFMITMKNGKRRMGRVNSLSKLDKLNQFFERGKLFLGIIFNILLS